MPITRNWANRPPAAPDTVANLAKAINVSLPIARILAQRGIDSFEAAKDFFRPDLNNLHSPMLMLGMDKAVERILQAMDAQETIMIYGDYDVDGTTSVAMTYTYLLGYYPHLIPYIPDRYQEGYGVSWRGIEQAQTAGVKLVIALDCGTKAIDKIAKAKEWGIDFIVCDHHRPGPELPEAIALLNPKQDGCPYPFKELTGCGIGFKLLQAWTEARELPMEPLFDLLDFVAVSTACDIVPIVGENRILAKFGIDQLNTLSRLGFRALTSQAQLKPPFNIGNLVFGIGPRINAAGRIAHANGALALLMATDEEEAKIAAKDVDTKNTTRKDYDEKITAEALEMIAQYRPEGYSNVLFKPDWHKGVIGIVASRCIEKYYRPTIILTESNGKATGSARSVAGFDIHEAIGACESLLEQYGGHAFAAGLTLPLENVPAFVERFEEVVRQQIQPEQLMPKITLDQWIRLDQITMNFYKILEQMAPFGPSNMRPIFASEVVCEAGNIRLLKEKYLKMKVKDPNGHASFDAIGFEHGEYYPILSALPLDTPFFLCYSIEENTFNGQTNLQLMIRDIKLELTETEREMMQATAN